MRVEVRLYATLADDYAGDRIDLRPHSEAFFPDSCGGWQSSLAPLTSS